jgi:hypothetical protein
MFSRSNDFYMSQLRLEEVGGWGQHPAPLYLVFRLKNCMYTVLSVSKSTELAGNLEFCCNPVVFSIIIPLPSLRPIRVVCSERRRKTRELDRIEFYTLANLRRIGKAKEVWRWRSLGVWCCLVIVAQLIRSSISYA